MSSSSTAVRGVLVKMDCIYFGFAGERKASLCVVRADKSWAGAEWLTDSSCMQRWVASAGFTLLAFACLQLAWCSCQPVIDEYHHLKCKRKRLCEGRHDELPPAGARRDTLGTSSSLSPFSLSLSLSLSPPLLVSTSLLPCPSLYPFLLLLLHLISVFTISPSLFSAPSLLSHTFLLLHSLLPPPLLSSLLYSSLFKSLLLSLLSVNPPLWLPCTLPPFLPPVYWLSCETRSPFCL